MRSAAILEQHLADERTLLKWDRRWERRALRSPCWCQLALANQPRTERLVLADRGNTRDRMAVVGHDQLGTVAHLRDVAAEVQSELPDTDFHAIHCSAKSTEL